MQKIIIDYIQNDLLSGQGDLQLTADEDLLTTGLIDSLGIMKLLAFLEETFDVKVPAEDMTIENFMTVELMENYMKSLKA
jgi:acyl carrier protein